MKLIRKVLAYTFNIPIHFYSKISPKKNNIWVFGSWFGEKFSDSSKYLFEHINKEHPEIRAVWLSKNETIIKELRSRGHEAYLTYSLKGYLISLQAAIGFICCSFEDLNLFCRPPIIVNLWHGIPLKKIVHDDKLSKLSQKSIVADIKNLIFPFTKKEFSNTFLTASSELESANLASAFKISKERILITGLPRNDTFKKASATPVKQTQKIIYMPTHRNEGDAKIPSIDKEQIHQITKLLEKHDLEIDIKLHHYHATTEIPQSSRIKIISDHSPLEDIYSKIHEYDILITDYSSIFFDFLLTNKPIIFFPFDINNYTKNDREFYYNYEEITPGPKLYNWNEIIDWIVKFKNNPELFSEERITVKNTFHEFQDFKSCERITTILLQKLIN